MMSSSGPADAIFSLESDLLYVGGLPPEKDLSHTNRQSPERFYTRTISEMFTEQHLPDAFGGGRLRSRFRQTHPVRPPDFYPSYYNTEWWRINRRRHLALRTGHRRVNYLYPANNPCDRYSSDWDYVHRTTRKGRFKAQPATKR